MKAARSTMQCTSVQLYARSAPRLLSSPLRRQSSSRSSIVAPPPSAADLTLDSGTSLSPSKMRALAADNLWFTVAMSGCIFRPQGRSFASRLLSGRTLRCIGARRSRFVVSTTSMTLHRSDTLIGGLRYRHRVSKSPGIALRSEPLLIPRLPFCAAQAGLVDCSHASCGDRPHFARFSKFNVRPRGMVFQ